MLYCCVVSATAASACSNWSMRWHSCTSGETSKRNGLRKETVVSRPISDVLLLVLSPQVSTVLPPPLTAQPFGDYFSTPQAEHNEFGELKGSGSSKPLVQRCNGSLAGGEVLVVLGNDEDFIFAPRARENIGRI